MHVDPDKLERLRRERRLTFTELARKADLHRETLRLIWNGETKDPRALTVSAIADVLGVDVDELAAREEGSAA